MATRFHLDGSSSYLCVACIGACWMGGDVGVAAQPLGNCAWARSISATLAAQIPRRIALLHHPLCTDPVRGTHSALARANRPPADRDGPLERATVESTTQRVAPPD